ncbi:sulfate transport system substrate-binding protein [Palleronia aestuarii]|uniref:Sulfate transport system substrate-binding protein n=1 Tax=Palleronia aestuarii TaxID=568105 RepID=A0A2W7MZ58_9RHOB|nr:thiosulfate ABC transporter substrate-binding protein CysP [Palleronia aestuarii]PZX12873.1 sulfate transport system substrate-binding protein [Palleronia aestuarii]
MYRHLALAATMATGLAAGHAQAQQTEILNVSYDIARELYAAINPAFLEQWDGEGELTINQSHAGSSTQARAILQGLQADLVTFNQVTDVNILAENGFVAEDWQDRFPNNASPYYSLPAFMVREGNPQGVEGWADLARDGVSVIFPNPKTSGNGRYTYLAALAWAEEEFDGNEEEVQSYMRDFIGNVEVFDTGGRGATTTFVERGIGDVLITFEAETLNISEETPGYEVVVPAQSLLAEFPVAIVDRVAENRGTEEIARAYLDFLYTTEGQEIVASFNNRVNDESVMEANADRFPEVELFTVEEEFGSWAEAQEAHFASGGSYDQLLRN